LPAAQSKRSTSIVGGRIGGENALYHQAERRGRRTLALLRRGAAITEGVAKTGSIARLCLGSSGTRRRRARACSTAGGGANNQVDGWWRGVSMAARIWRRRYSGGALGLKQSGRNDLLSRLSGRKAMVNGGFRRRTAARGKPNSGARWLSDVAWSAWRERQRLVAAINMVAAAYRGARRKRTQLTSRTRACASRHRRALSAARHLAGQSGVALDNKQIPARYRRVANGILARRLGMNWRDERLFVRCVRVTLHCIRMAWAWRKMKNLRRKPAKVANGRVSAWR